MTGHADVKHKIKSVDRLLGNKKLHKEIIEVYKHFFGPILNCFPTVSILVDWSGCCGNDRYMLRASLAFSGRSIPVYNEVHPKKMVGKRKIQYEFLNNLKKMILPHIKVIIVTDAGFVTPWFRHVRRLGWDFIGRLPGYINVKLNAQWIKVKNITHQKKDEVKKLGKVIVCKWYSRFTCNLYSYLETSKKRKEKSKFPDQNKLYTKLAKTPWILATSLSDSEFNGNFVKNRYKERMQIEQNFRDEKSPRFGFGWRFGRTTCIKRTAVLCLIAHIAEFLLICIGINAESLNLHRKFQVNTRKSRVLSYITLAKQILIQGVPPDLKIEYGECMRVFISSSLELQKC